MGVAPLGPHIFDSIFSIVSTRVICGRSEPEERLQEIIQNGYAA